MNGDDFGFSEAHNAGIIKAHRAGVLSSASLMMGGSACREAVRLAKCHPQLAVGLHLSFSDTSPVLPAEMVPLLVPSGSVFPPDERAIIPALWSAEGRRQIRAEIGAQFAAFHQTGMVCDHVNAHRNVHLHPLLALMVFRAAARWQVNAVRIPWDPESKPFWRNRAGCLRAAVLRSVARYYHLRAPRRSLGRIWDVPQLLDALSSERCAGTEYYFHPIEDECHMFGHDLPTLLDKNISRALRCWGLCGYRAAGTVQRMP